MNEPTVRADVRKFLDWMNSLPGPRSHEVGPARAREIMRDSRHLFDVAMDAGVLTRDLAAPGPGGDIPLRLYDCRTERGPGPILLFLHGGGFVLGDLDTHDPLCASIARGLDLPVVAVDYRLAPECPFPAGVEDCEAAARWIASAPPGLERQATGLVLAGDSAGGNLAIVTALALRDAPAEVPVLAQWLVYPAADPAVAYPSFDQFSAAFSLTRESMNWFGQCYVGDGDDWRYSPLLRDQSGLPPTLVITAGLDPLRDQGRAYAAACASAGVETVYLEAEGTIHGFLLLRKAIPSAEQDLQRCLDHLKLLLAGRA